MSACFTPYTKFNSMWMKAINVRAKIIRLQEEKTQWKSL